MTRKTTIVIAVAVAAGLLSGCARSAKSREEVFLKRGKDFFASKDFARAVLEFKNAVQAVPRDAEAYYQLGLAYLASQDQRSGVSALMRASELDGKHVGAQMKLAQLMLATRDTDLAVEAQQRLGAVLAMTPDDESALNMMAAAEWQLGKKSESERRLLDLLNKFPRSISTAINLAKQKLFTNDFPAAEQILKNIAAQNPPVAGAFLALGELYATRGRKAEAEVQFARALQLEPGNPQGLAGAAAVAFSLGKHQEAGAIYQRLSRQADTRYQHLYGAFLLQTDQLPAATAEFERLNKADPNNREARTRLVAVYFGSNRTADAQRVLGAVLKKNPKDLQALTQRSWIYLTKRQYQEAQTDLTQVLRLQPDSAEAHYYLARVHMARGGILQGRDELTEALKADPEFLPARIDLARVFIATQAGKDALRLMQDTPEHQRNSIAVIIQRNWAYASLDDAEGLRKGIEEGLRTGENVDLYLQSALLELATSRPAQARVLVERVLAKAPQDLRALGLLVRCYEMSKQTPALAATLQEYAGKHQDSAPVQEFVGEFFLANNRVAEARSAFAAARRTDPTYVPAGIALVTMDAREGKLVEARKQAAALLAVNLTNPEVRMLLAKIEHVAGDYKAAMDDYRKVIELQPSESSALNNLAYLLVDRESNPDEALKYAQRAAEVAPKDPKVIDTLGWVLYSKSLYGAALQHFERLQDDKTALHQYHLAMAYFKTGNARKGREALNRAVALNPGLPETKLAQALAQSAAN